ncbi:BlaI/MecI/CopY family transcriptional regulator [Brassicibacter mesophilus]|uniref:BlaI/MecI/CopY family transcriptional regulator n=1 Tax=Brassicibacter mesophilus TaxID=745119 RepID=UPI003D1D7929
MKKSIQISDAEWEIMEVLWNESPQASKDIITRIQKYNDWKPTTIKTLISRLVDKNILDYEKKGKLYYYYPTLEKEECMKIKNKNYLKKFYNGGLKAMLASFLDMEELSNEDIDEIKAILEQKKD